MAIVDELVTLLTLQGAAGNQAAADKQEKALDKIGKRAAIAGAALLGLATATAVWVREVANAVDSSGKFAASIGENYEDLQEFEFAVKRAGGEIGGLRSDLEKLAGVSGRKATDIISDLAKEFDGLSAAQARQLGQQFGLSGDTILLLQQGSDGIARLRKEARDLGVIVPESATKEAALFKDQLTNIGEVIRSVSLQAGVGLLPVLTEVTQRMTTFIVQNRALIRGGLETFIRGVTKGFELFFMLMGRIIQAVKEILSPLGEFSDELDAVNVIAIAVAATLTLLVGWLATLAAGAVAAAAPFVALAVALEDLYQFIEGNDSVLGRFIDTLERRFPNAVKRAREAIQELRNAFSKQIETVIEGGKEIISFESDRLLSFLEEFDRSLGGGMPARIPAAVNVPRGSTTNNNQRSGVVNNTFNIRSTEPKQVANEIVRRSGNAQKLVTPGVNTAIID